MPRSTALLCFAAHASMPHAGLFYSLIELQVGVVQLHTNQIQAKQIFERIEGRTYSMYYPSSCLIQHASFLQLPLKILAPSH